MMDQLHQVDRLSRRTFLRNSLLVAGASLGGSALALPPQDAEPTIRSERQLRLFNVNTREKLDVVYWRDGQYIDHHLGQIFYLMRDHHANKSKKLDPNLLDFLYKLSVKLDTPRRIHVLSGYRTAETNATLRKHSLGVALKSFHTKGRAVDFYIPGIKNEAVQAAARRLVLGGVGHYESAGFVHLDTGYPRHWVRT